MMVLGNYKGQWCRFALWTLGPGKPTLHFKEERIPVETIQDIKDHLQLRGVTDIKVHGEPWEFKDEDKTDV